VEKNEAQAMMGKGETGVNGRGRQAHNDTTEADGGPEDSGWWRCRLGRGGGVRIGTSEG
jgi:hypothetical protein